MKSLVRRDPIGLLFSDFFGPRNEIVKDFLQEPKDPVQFSTEEDAENYYIRGVIPGFGDSEMNISTNENVLTISGKQEKTSEEKSIFKSERSSFEQSYTLPQDVIVDDINAEYRAGVLVVTLPRKQKAIIEPKQIEIKCSDTSWNI